MNEDRVDKDYQIMELKQRVNYYEPYKQKYEDLKEDWKYIKSLLDKEFNEKTRLKKENEELRQEVAHWKHRVNSLLWILGQFDKGKVRELLKEIEDE